MGTSIISGLPYKHTTIHQVTPDYNSMIINGSGIWKSERYNNVLAVHFIIYLPI